MSKAIHVLEQTTIDKIAAGEVVERPGSIVKELCENAIDAGASALTVEIRDGGNSMIRVTDNGEGIAPDQVRTAFLRHATSKIDHVEDLESIRSFGFRGEALSSIAAVSRVELITKTPDALTGVRYKVEGGRELLFEEIGAPDGSTFVVRDLFYNTPARRKFLKSAQTEAGQISDFTGRLALSHPEIAVKLIINGKTKLATSGAGRAKDVIYALYGKEITANLVEVDAKDEESGMRLSGWIGKPVISRGNRAQEILFVNGRLVFNSTVSKAAEEGYETFLMQHRFPFLILMLDMDGKQVDVNVHPAKAQVRFSDGPAVYAFVRDTVRNTLSRRDLIVETGPDTQSEEAVRRKEAFQRAREAAASEPAPEPFEVNRRMLERTERDGFEPLKNAGFLREDSPYGRRYPEIERQRAASRERIEASGKFLRDVTQLSVFDESFTPDQGRLPFLSEEARPKHRMIGQLFETYWLIEYEDSLYIVDQHAAHEKVMFERLMEKYRTKKAASQMLSPSLIVTLTLSEEAVLEQNRESFEEIGFEIGSFGGHDYAVSAVPQDLFGMTEKEFFLEMLDSLSEENGKQSVEDLTARVATMACKAAVKGNTRLSTEEADELISELLTLENPYNCPHGRPTIISMSKRELEKKFHRIV